MRHSVVLVLSLGIVAGLGLIAVLIFDVPSYGDTLMYFIIDTFIPYSVNHDLF